MHDIENCLTAIYVTRTKENIRCEIISSGDPNQSTGIISDQIVRLTGYKSSKSYPEEFRLVVFEDNASGIVYKFITNGFNLPALAITELYREGWKIELFFKWIKQQLHIKAFYGTSSNAVYCHNWIAAFTYLLIAISRKKLDLAISLYNFAQTMGLTLLEKTPIKELFINNYNPISLSDENQLSFWNSYPDSCDLLSKK